MSAHGEESVCICATSMRMSIRVRFSGIESSVRPALTHVVARSCGERKTGTDWSGSSVRLVMSSWLGSRAGLGLRLGLGLGLGLGLRLRLGLGSGLGLGVGSVVSGQWLVVRVPAHRERERERV